MKFHSCSLFALLLTAPLLHGQIAVTAPGATWSTVTSENTSISVTLPVGTTYRLGDYTHNLWSESVTVTAATTINPVSMASGDPFPFSDPDPGTVKELDVIETTVPQTISITNAGVYPGTPTALIIPAIVPPTSVPVTPGTSYTLTFSNFAISPTVGPNALMLALVNAPATNANQAWEGTQMNLTIDGVTLVCTYGQVYTDGVFTLTCTVPATASTTSTVAVSPTRATSGS